MNQRIDALQGTGKVALEEIVDDHYFNVASVDVGETLLILGVFRGADNAVRNPRFRV